ncbi:hypothetical protein G5714_003984 [Onychostoma macrolepis]|uniref:Uncharacterized protein n=1 Tax=Onychostoma macrolepis TaxID=369639 RepID=A0A7J6DBU9_9TELE|nr:hypothetical protein G5714_003984 [Onychostoma macrolepis]
MDVGILIIPDGDDALDYYVVLEEQIALRDAIDLPHAAALLVGLIFALNIDYPKKLRYTFEDKDITTLHPETFHKCDKREETLSGRSSSGELETSRLIQFSGEHQPLIDMRKKSLKSVQCTVYPSLQQRKL